MILRTSPEFTIGDCVHYGAVVQGNSISMGKAAKFYEDWRKLQKTSIWFETSIYGAFKETHGREPSGHELKRMVEAVMVEPEIFHTIMYVASLKIKIDELNDALIEASPDR